MIQIQLEPAIEAQLAAEAHARGVGLEDYIQRIVAARPVQELNVGTVAEAVRAIRELRKGNLLGDLNVKDLVHEGHKY
jgi:hypothetical protein